MFPATLELGVLSLWSQLQLPCQFLVVTDTYLTNVIILYLYFPLQICRLPLEFMHS